MFPGSGGEQITMENTFVPEEVSPDSLQFPPFNRYMLDYQRAHGLTQMELTWFITQIGENVPFDFLILWQHFPEWELTRQKNIELQMVLGVGRGEPHKRILELAVQSKVVAHVNHL